MGAYAKVEDEQLHLLGLVAMPDGTKELRAELSGKACDAEEIGRKLAQQIAQSGGVEILEKVRTLNNQ